MYTEWLQMATVWIYMQQRQHKPTCNWTAELLTVAAIAFCQQSHMLVRADNHIHMHDYECHSYTKHRVPLDLPMTKSVSGNCICLHISFPNMLITRSQIAAHGWHACTPAACLQFGTLYSRYIDTNKFVMTLLLHARGAPIWPFWQVCTD